MDKGLIIGLLLIAFTQVAFSQKEGAGITTEITSDTIYLGNPLELKYSVKNLEVKFEGPGFGDLRIISGPNISTSMQFINGKMSSALSYSYTIYPEEIGSFYIEPAYFSAADTIYETPPINILVIPNPDDIKMDRRQFKLVEKQALSATPVEPKKPIFRKKKKKI